MTKEELATTITNAIQQLGFARIPIAGILDVFAPSQPASLALHDELKSFAESHGWTIQQEEADLITFYPLGSEPPQAS